MVPLIDLSVDEHVIADELSHLLERIGFFVIINHGLPDDLIAQAFAEAERFHAQPMEAKRALLMNEHNNGYMAMARYNVRTSRVSEAASKPDMNEAFFVKRERPSDHPLVRAGRRFAGPNRWPEGLPGFRETVLAYCGAADALGLRLLAPLAISLGLDRDFFRPFFTESQFSFRLSHYPPAEPEPDRFGIAAHTDTNFLTLLAQSDEPGLQIRPEGGGWQDVPHIPGSIVVNTGDMLHRWTNGRYRSTPHRAVMPRERPRYAIPYFLGPNLDAEIRCLPTCSGPGNPPRYPPIEYGEFLVWWYDANYNAQDQQDLAEAI